MQALVVCIYPENWLTMLMLTKNVRMEIYELTAESLDRRHKMPVNLIKINKAELYAAIVLTESTFSDGISTIRHCISKLTSEMMSMPLVWATNRLPALTQMESTVTTDLIVDWIKLLYYTKMKPILIGTELLLVTTLQRKQYGVIMRNESTRKAISTC